MTFSNPSWYPLSTWDPVPGDPVAVRTAGQGYERVAAQIQTASELGDRLVAHLAQLLPDKRSQSRTAPDPVFSELYNRVRAGSPAGLEYIRRLP